MTPALIVAAVHQPVGIRRLGQHRVGDRLEAFQSPFHRQAKARGGIGRRGPRSGGRGRRLRHHCHLAVGDARQLHRLVAGQGDVARLGAIGGQHIGHDLAVDIRVQAVAVAIGHRGLDQIVELGGRAFAPGRQESGARQRRRFACAFQLGPVAGGAIGDIQSAAGAGLLRGERPLVQRKRSRAQHRGGEKGCGERLFHFWDTSSCGRNPAPATGTSSPAKGCGGSSHPVRLPSGAFWLLIWT